VSAFPDWSRTTPADYEESEYSQARVKAIDGLFSLSVAVCGAIVWILVVMWRWRHCLLLERIQKTLDAAGSKTAANQP